MSLQQRGSALSKVIVALVAVAVLVIAAGWMVGAFTDKTEPGLIENTTSAPENLWLVETQPVAIYETVPATAEPKQAAIIAARIMAGISEVRVRAGDQVAQGDPLVILDNTDLMAKVRQAADHLRAMKVRYEDAKTSLKRVESLRQQKLVSVADLDAAKTQAQTLAAELAAAENALTEAQTAASFAMIVSPISGKVVDRFVEPGAMALPGEALVSIYDPSSIRLEAHVRESISANLQLGDTLEGEIPALQQSVKAVIEEIVPAANNTARSFLIKARMESDPRVLPGMYARLEVPAGEESQILIPQSLVRQVGQQSILWVWTDEYVRRFVRLGRTQGDKVQVISGLEAGDQLAKPPL